MSGQLTVTFNLSNMMIEIAHCHLCFNLESQENKAQLRHQTSFSKLPFWGNVPRQRTAYRLITVASPDPSQRRTRPIGLDLQPPPISVDLLFLPYSLAQRVV